jgi:hypothetical protein
VTSPADLAATLRASRRVLLQTASGVTPESAVKRPADGEWSVIEVLAHLIDTDYHYAAQAVAMRDKPPHMLAYFNDGAWKEEHANVRELALVDVLARLDESHNAVLRQLASMSAEDLDAPGLHPRGIPYTVRDVFLRLPAHDENHTRQIEEIIAS